MAVYSIDVVQTLLAITGQQVLVSPLSEREQDELNIERAREDRVRERREDDIQRADQLAAELRELDEIIRQSLLNRNAERGAVFDIVV